MRPAAALLALLLAAPCLAGAQERARPPGEPSHPAPSAQPSPPSAPAPAARPDPFEASPGAPAVRADRPPPPESARTSPPPPRSRGPWGPPPPGYGYGYGYTWWPYGWGYGWGWGYEPLYPVYPERRSPPDVGVAPAPHPLGATLRATAATGPRDSGTYGLAFAADGRRGGFDLSIDAFAPSRGGVMTTGLNGTEDAYGFGSAHLAFPILEGASYRLRLQAGGSWLSVPANPLGAAVDAFGFDLGASATVGLVGPLGLEGHAHVTPFPVRVIDLRAAVALRAGPFSLLGGYRVLDLAADSRTGPAARFEGPELGLGVIF